MTVGCRRQTGVSLLLILAVLALAAAAGGAAAWLIISRVDLTLLLRDQPLQAIIPQAITGRAEVRDDIGLRLTETIRTTVPVDQEVTIPIRDTLNIVAFFQGEIPLRMQVQLKDSIPLKQVIDLNTTIEAYLPEFESTVEIAVRGKIPVDTEVPVDLTIPIDQDIFLDFTTPVSARIDQNLTVPLRTHIDADVPIDAALSVPILNELQARVRMPTGPSNVVIQRADLTLPLRTLKLGLIAPDEGPEATP